LICIWISKAYAQKQVAIIGNFEYSKNKFLSYPQTAFGVLYRQKQNTYGLSIDNIGTDFNTIFKTGFYHIVGARGFYYRHFNKHKLSGAYAGALITYTPFKYAYGIKFRYNEEPLNPFPSWCGTGIPPPVQYQQLKAIPVFGYEYYPCKRFSVYTEAGYGIMYLRAKTTTRDFDFNIVTKYATEMYENFNFKIGIKSVLYYRAKAL
jgi:hypothetical protein